MECFVCKELNVTLGCTSFIPLQKLSSNDVELLKRRLFHIIKDEKKYVSGCICKVHKDDYLKFYSVRQKACCDPFEKHPNSLRKKSLKTISLKMSISNPNNLIPGKKLCILCYNLLHQSTTKLHIPTTINIESITDPDFSSSEMSLEQLNKCCDILNLSPVRMSKYSSKRRFAYMHKKVESISTCVASKAAVALNVENISEPEKSKDYCSDCAYLTENLFNKFKNAPLKEKVQILTLVPESWTIQQTKTYFNTTEYLVKKARKIKATEGLLGIPIGRKSVKLSSDVVEKVIKFYCDDSNSRVCPGKKDCISVPSENGRIIKQKRLILYNLKDLYLAFKEENHLKIGFSKFCSLRPRECVTVNNKGIHSVCTCIYHQNVKLMLHAIHINDYIPFLKKLVCSIESEKCMVHRCENCPSPNILKDELMLSEELEMHEEITFKQWVKTDGAELKTVVYTVDEFIDSLISKLTMLCAHHYITKTQSFYFKNSKSNIDYNTAIIVADFSENYTCIVQDEIQSFHWKKEQVTVHPFLAYMRDTTSDTIKPTSMCVISDCLIHDATTFLSFQKVIIKHLITQNPNIKHIKYFSNGSSAQYKNYKNFVNLCHHEEDHGITAEWHFFRSCHGKGACDGIGATVKRTATRASLQRPYTDSILKAYDLYTFCRDAVKGIECFFVKETDVEISKNYLTTRYEKVSTVSGTRVNHSYIPMNKTQLKVARVSGSSSSTFIATMGCEEIKPSSFSNEQYVACIYSNNWWIGKILEFCEQYNDYKIMFMHPHGPSPSYVWPKSIDICWIPYEQIIKMITPPITTTGRTYNLSKEENSSIELLFQNFSLN